jgi:predicted DNA binding CopG/RHH family protein
VNKLDADEQELLKSVEDGEWESKGNIAERGRELKRAVKTQKKRSISIRISENDLYALKKKALETAVPYQTLIQMLIRRYTGGQIILSA